MNATGTMNIFQSYLGYVEEQVLNAISILPKTSKGIIELKYGLNDQQIEVTRKTDLVMQKQLSDKASVKSPEKAVSNTPPIRT